MRNLSVSLRERIYIYMEVIRIDKDELVCPDCGSEDIKSTYNEDQTVCNNEHFNDFDQLITIDEFKEGSNGN